MTAFLETSGPAHFEVRFRREGESTLPVLVWQPRAPMRAIATTPHGDGIGLRRWVIIAQVLRLGAGRDPGRQLAKLGVSLGLRGNGVGMVAVGDVRRTWSLQDQGVGALATVNLRQRIAAVASKEPRPAGVAGSTNVVAVLPEAVSDAELINAVATITDTSARALRDAGLVAADGPGNAICILCPNDGVRHGPGGRRPEWEAPLARAAYAAVSAGARAPALSSGEPGRFRSGTTRGRGNERP